MGDAGTATPLPVARLVNFAEVAGGWNVVSCTPGPDGGLTILLCEATYLLQIAPTIGWTARWVDADQRVRYRIVHLGAEQPAPALDLVAGGSVVRSAHRARGFGWVVTAEREAWVLADDGTEQARFRIGLAGPSQITADGRLWCGYGDEQIFTSQPEDAGIGCFEPDGRLALHFNDRSERSGQVPSVWTASGINVVSDHETWVSYYAIWPDAEVQSRSSHAVVRLWDYDASSVWPWPACCGNANLEPSGPFAVAGDRILVQGSGYGLGSRDPDQPHPYARLYLMSLTGGDGRAFLPVDERGDWIGPFRVEGCGSRFYLSTTTALFVVDAADAGA